LQFRITTLEERQPREADQERKGLLRIHILLDGGQKLDPPRIKTLVNSLYTTMGTW
jgi:hypothetical protein